MTVKDLNEIYKIVYITSIYIYINIASSLRPWVKNQGFRIELKAVGAI